MDKSKLITLGNLETFKSSQDTYNDGIYAKKSDLSTATGNLDTVSGKVDTLESTVSGLESTVTGLGSSKADKDSVYTKDEVDGKVSSVYKYKGSKANRAALPTEGNVVGDVWNLEDTGMNVAWTGSAWDDLGSSVDLSDYAKTSDIKTKLSEMTNDANYVVDASYVHTDNNYSASEKAEVAKVSTIEGYINTINGKISTLEAGDSDSVKTVKVNGTALTKTDGAVNVTVPTKLTDLTNDGNYVIDADYVHTANSYTTAEKTKLAGVAENAQVNVIETIKVNGTALTPASKVVDITVPVITTATESDITGLFN